MRRITKAALGGLAGCALVLGGTQGASAALEAKYWFRAVDLTDLLTADVGPFDGARATTTIAQKTNDKTTFRIRVRGIQPSAAGQEFAAHLHVGPCDNSGGHYQNLVPGPVDSENEVWFALVPEEDGTARSDATVKFVPDDAKPAYAGFTPGEMSIVVHQGPITAPSLKQACFPLSVPQWADPI